MKGGGGFEGRKDQAAEVLRAGSDQAAEVSGITESVFTWQQLLDQGTERLQQAGIREAGQDAWYLLEASFPIDRVHFLMDRNRPVHEEILRKGRIQYEANLTARASRIPLQQILGTQVFMGLSFRVNSHVLIPRQDTETLVETVLRENQDRDCSVLDMCTGSGCIAISLSVLGKYRSVTAADVSEEALLTAGKNAKALFLIQKDVVKSRSLLVSEHPWRLELTAWTLHPAGERGRLAPAADGGRADLAAASGVRTLCLAQSSLFSNLAGEPAYDVIVSNPPYIPTSVIHTLEPEVRDHEPRLALDGREDGLYFYRRLAAESGRYLKDGGRLYVEIGCDQAEAVCGLLADGGYRNISVVKDEPGLDRVVKAVWRSRERQMND